MKKEKVTLIFHGEKDWYSESGSFLSPLTHEDGTRTDWGKLQIILNNGKEVKIRQATKKEIEKMEQKLEKIKKEYSK